MYWAFIINLNLTSLLVMYSHAVLPQHPEIGPNSVPSAPKVTTLPTELKEISTRPTSRDYLNLL